MSEEKPISPLKLVDRPADLKARFEAVISKPEIVERICDHVANGGSLVHLCRMWAISYYRMMRWIKSQPNGEAMYNEALNARKEWAAEMVESDLYNFAQTDIREIFTDSGEVINPKDLDDHIAPGVQSIKVKTRYTEDGDKEVTHEIQLVDKLKARDMINRMQGKYVDKHEHSGSVNLVDIIAGSFKKDEKPK